MIADKTDGKLTRKDVKGILEAVATIAYAELKKNGVFVFPGMVVVKKPVTKGARASTPSRSRK